MFEFVLRVFFKNPLHHTMLTKVNKIRIGENKNNCDLR